jgi:hypothetical protein
MAMTRDLPRGLPPSRLVQGIEDGGPDGCDACDRCTQHHPRNFWRVAPLVKANPEFRDIVLIGHR